VSGSLSFALLLLQRRRRRQGGVAGMCQEEEEFLSHDSGVRSIDQIDRPVRAIMLKNRFPGRPGACMLQLLAPRCSACLCVGPLRHSFGQLSADHI
jgi:hypothetical protein